MELALFVYLIDVVGNVGVGTPIVLAISLFMIVFRNMFEHIENSRTPDFVGVYRIAIVTAAVSAVLLIFVPSKNTMYLMAGAYAGQQIATSETTNKLLSKTLVAIEQHLDDLIEPKKESK